jgi:hypothetical protein
MSTTAPRPTTPRKRRFVLLRANIETLAPAVYARTPTAVVSDAVARTASEVIERALNFSLDAIDFADIMNALRDEYLLVGRGQAWVRYVPHMRTAPADDPDGGTADDTAQYDEVVWEEAIYLEFCRRFLDADLVEYADHAALQGPEAEGFRAMWLCHDRSGICTNEKKLFKSPCACWTDLPLEGRLR